MRMEKPQVVDGLFQAKLGEGPIWVEDTLWWVDILGHKVLSYHPETGTERVFEFNNMVGTVVPAKAGGVLAAVFDEIVHLDPVTGETTVRCQVDAGNPGTRLNDGKCGPDGRLYVGTLDLAEEAPNGNLYVVDHDFSVRRIYEGVTVSNGLVWSGDTMYYIDSPRRHVMAFDWDSGTGEIANERVAIDFAALGVDGYPDGMSIDADGNLWVCQWAGFGVTCFDPVGVKVVERIEFPVANVTACAFGGSDMKTLYVTTASKGLSEEEKAAQPLAGCLFSVAVGVAGVSAERFG